MQQFKLQAGDKVYTEGDVGDEAYAIVSGQVVLFSENGPKENILAVLKAGDIFGEAALLDVGVERVHSARAAEDTVINVTSRDEFQSMLNGCPEAIRPFIFHALSRLRQAPRARQAAEGAPPLLEDSIKGITVLSDSPACPFEPVRVMLARLPFKIGGYNPQDESTRNPQNHLLIPSDGPPLVVSRQHCQLEIDSGKLYLNDLGSRFGTIVNGILIGRGKGVYKTTLKAGENPVILGTADSPYRIKIICE